MKELWYHGTFLTMDEACDNPEAVLVEQGIITKTGDFEKLKDEPDVVLRDMEGHTILPGFLDGHSHISAVANKMLLANLNPPPVGFCDSVSGVIRELKAFMERHNPEKSEWIMGMGYDNSVFPDGKHPTKKDLDLVSTTNPVAAIHVSGHLCVVNTKGMECLGYTGENFSVPQGGVVESWGLLKEQAFLGVDKMGEPSLEAVLNAMSDAWNLYASYGITTAHDGKTREKEYEILKLASERGLLLGDVVMYLTPETAQLVLPHINPEKLSYENHLRPAGVKLFLDGSPQGKTAWLSKPYYIVPEGEEEDYAGFPVQNESEAEAIMVKAIKNQWQINVHANGDEAIEQMIRCYQNAMGKASGGEKLRPVIIHCQTVRWDQLERMKKMGMIASFFLDHVYYWGDYHYESVLGPDRAALISPLNWALETGVSFSLHQDSPIVPPNVLLSVHNAVNRITLKGRELGKNQRISVLEALKAVTIKSAYQIFEEKRKGSITVGKLADFVVLDKNPLEVPKKQIKEIQVLETVKEGKTIWKCNRGQ